MEGREEERAKRLAAALRENLKRRKIQARRGTDRAVAAADTPPDTDRDSPTDADD
jgi:hypothetical protein